MYPQYNNRTEQTSLVCCTSCGDFFSSTEIVEITGWCKTCSGYLEQEHVFELYLSVHADHIEHYISTGLTFREALALLRLERRPVCLSCGGVLDRAPPNTIFCRRNETCRKYARR